MLHLSYIRENPDLVRAACQAKGDVVDVESILQLDESRKKTITQLDVLRAEQNKTSKLIGQCKREKKDPSEILQKMKDVSKERQTLEAELGKIEGELHSLLVKVPNIPHPSVPKGGPDKNELVRTWGEKPQFDFSPLPHYELGEKLDILDLPRASKITGSGFVVFRGLGARLQRALINFMLDLHTTKHGYQEVLPPFLVNRQSMVGTGQLPKLEQDMYHISIDDLFLIPTAEVPVTNLHRDEELDVEKLPIKLTAYTACFRREAGSYGQKTRGMVRVHQFDKVELVKFCQPETSYDELEKLLVDAEEVLQLLGIHYRVMLLAEGDLSFAAAKCYDIEIWAAGVEDYLEISSCSNFEEFQARRSNIRYRDDSRKLRYIHTLNGSGVALARLIVAVLENYQQEDGSIKIPEVLREYMGGIEFIVPST